MTTARLAVQVVCALPSRQVVIDLEVPAGTTLRQAVERSRIAERLPGFALGDLSYGVFGTVRDPGELVRDGDRVELYRALADDPKAIRRRRASEQSARKTPRSSGS